MGRKMQGLKGGKVPAEPPPVISKEVRLRNLPGCRLKLKGFLLTTFVEMTVFFFIFHFLLLIFYSYRNVSAGFLRAAFNAKTVTTTKTTIETKIETKTKSQECNDIA